MIFLTTTSSFLRFSLSILVEVALMTVAETKYYRLHIFRYNFYSPIRHKPIDYMM